MISKHLNPYKNPRQPTVEISSPSKKPRTLPTEGVVEATAGVAIVADAATINYGAFINNVISFVIVTFAVFLLVKAINTVRTKMEKAEAKEAAAVAPTEKVCPYCCTKIPVDAIRCPHCTSELNAKK